MFLQILCLIWVEKHCSERLNLDCYLNFPEGSSSGSGGSGGASTGSSAAAAVAAAANAATGAGNSVSMGAAGGSNSAGNRLGVREMMQRAVTAARSASSSLADLDVDEDVPIPTLHWPPDHPGVYGMDMNAQAEVFESTSNQLFFPSTLLYTIGYMLQSHLYYSDC